MILSGLEECGLTAERRSIYEDIREINLISLMVEEDCTLDEAKAMLEGDAEDDLKTVVYDVHRTQY